MKFSFEDLLLRIPLFFTSSIGYYFTIGCLHQPALVQEIGMHRDGPLLRFSYLDSSKLSCYRGDTAHPPLLRFSYLDCEYDALLQLPITTQMINDVVVKQIVLFTMLQSFSLGFLKKRARVMIKLLHLPYL